jgi:lysophospholipase L1-like esterase
VNRLRVKVAAVFFSVLVGCALFELLLRIAGVGAPAFVQVDRVTGVAHVPGARGYFTREGRGWVEISSAGLRGPERALRKPENTLRLAFLGDSFTEALQVNEEASFTGIVERRLAERLGQRVEVLNFGVSGFGTTEEYLSLKHRVWKFAPDAVILCFLTANDVADNHATLRHASHLPQFQIVDGELRLDERYMSSELQRTQDDWSTRVRRGLSQHSRLAQVAIAAGLAFGSRSESDRKTPSAGAEAGLDMDVYREPATPVWREAWEITERLLLAMRDEARLRAVPFYLVILSNGPQVHPDATLREQIARELGVGDLFYPDLRLTLFAEHAGIPALALAHSMADEALANRVFFHGFGNSLGTGHWNENGHRAAAERIAPWLEERVNERRRGSTAQRGERP